MSEPKCTGSEREQNFKINPDVKKDELALESTECNVNENRSRIAKSVEHSATILNQNTSNGTRNSAHIRVPGIKGDEKICVNKDQAELDQNRQQRYNLPKETQNQDLSNRKSPNSSLPRASSCKLCKNERPRWNSSSKIDRRDYSFEKTMKNWKPISSKYCKLQQCDQSVYDRLYKISSHKRSKSSPPIKSREEVVQNIAFEDSKNTSSFHTSQNMALKAINPPLKIADQADKGGFNHHLTLPISCQSENECSKQLISLKSATECQGVKDSKTGLKFNDCQGHTSELFSNYSIIDNVQEETLISLNKKTLKSQIEHVINESLPLLSTPENELYSTDTLECYESDHALASIESNSHYAGPIILHLVNQTDHMEICSAIREGYNRNGTHFIDKHKENYVPVNPTDTTEQFNSAPPVFYANEKDLMLENVQYDSDIQFFKMSPKKAIVSIIDESNLYNIVDSAQERDDHEVDSWTSPEILQPHIESSNFDELSDYSLSLCLTDLYNYSDYEDEYLFDQNNPSGGELRCEISTSNMNCWNRRFEEYATEFTGFYNDFSEDFLLNDEPYFVNVSNAKGLEGLHSFSEDISATMAEMRQYASKVNENKTIHSNSNFVLPPEVGPVESFVA
ncbi:hypothetical protein ACTXT7_005834 [Hymenolepis weldensis]